MAKLSQSTKAKDPISLANYPQIKNINLPKLDRIIMKNAVHQQERKQERAQVDINTRAQVDISNKRGQVDISNMLKIEGRSNQQQQRYDYEYEMSKKQADRDIRAELRKIYNLRPSPKKSRRVVELPRIG